MKLVTAGYGGEGVDEAVKVTSGSEARPDWENIAAINRDRDVRRESSFLAEDVESWVGMLSLGFWRHMRVRYLRRSYKPEEGGNVGRK